MQEYLDRILFSIGDQAVSLGQIVAFAMAVILFVAVWAWLFKRFLPRFFDRHDITVPARRRVQLRTHLLMFTILIWFLVQIIGFDLDLIPSEEVNLTLSSVILTLAAYQLARLLDWFFSGVLIERYLAQREAPPPPAVEQQPKVRAGRTIQMIVYLAVAIFMLKAFGLEDFFTSPPLIKDKDLVLSLTNILYAIIFLLVAQLIVWLFTHLILYRYYHRKGIDVGAQFAINQLLRYVVFIIAFLAALQVIGFDLTLIGISSAALLVGIGLGLQQTFNDLFSGIIMLFERRVEVDDVVEIDGLVGTVRQIGLRTSLVETRDNITVIVPNSKIITEKVVNWSHYDSKARFTIKLGVAYGSDTELVKKSLLDVARANPYVIRKPEPSVRFTNFGASSLDFELLFWSHELVRIEDVKSDLRFEIDKVFRTLDISIPFPQQDVWFKNSPPS